jgi:hypothetical protein
VTDLRRILHRCRCGKDIPVRVSEEVLRAVAPLGPMQVVLTYGCRRCGIVTVTLAAFHKTRLAA